MENKIIINMLASDNGIAILDKEEGYLLMPLIKFKGVQPTGIRENLYDKNVKNKIINDIVYNMSSDKQMSEDEESEIRKKLSKKIDTNIYTALRSYNSEKNTFFKEKGIHDEYVEIMMKKREKLPNETNRQYKERVKSEEAKELEQIGIIINYDLRGIMSGRMTLMNKIKLMLDSIKNRHISSMEFGPIKRGENPIPDEEDLMKEENETLEEATIEPVKDEEKPENSISAPENMDSVTQEIEPAKDGEELETPINTPEKTDSDVPEVEPAKDEEEFETPISAPEKTDSDALGIELEDEKNEYKKSLAYLMGRKTGKVIRKVKKTINSKSEDLKNESKKIKGGIQAKSQDVVKNAKVFKENTAKVTNKIVEDSKTQIGKTYTAASGTLEMMRRKVKEADFRKKVAKKIAVAGLMGVMVAGTLTAIPKANTIKVDNENKQANSSSSVVFVEEDSENKDEITIEDKQETTTVEKKDIELKDTLTESIEDNVGIGTKVILSQGKYYADPNGTGKAYDLEKFTAKYGNEFKITRINIVTAEGKNVQINLENGNGMTYSKIKEMYPDCEIVAAHLANGNMQVGWTNIDMIHAVLNNLDLPKNTQKVIANNQDGKISESESKDIEQAISEALERLQENQKGEER